MANFKALNQNLVSCTTPSEVLNVFITTGGARATAGNGTFNTVNFSTSLHRIAKIQQTLPTNLRRQTLSDPRFAVLICAVAEAVVEKVSPPGEFKSRELSNICWALAKLG
eukprot:CAMPEP_0172501272 /NCGR_PEP_ID=MMETSP1066-20121228/147837_1 /TAXON_ID=671091 /ORGANISM="Coscinodiscus wailesii, Strain CCMP2513" /LENGTH=109 /DNA_ID=CAMNT_0013275947 /DNA_START=587 /DNA_END=913 /DNA_ORIENTATION=-